MSPAGACVQPNYSSVGQVFSAQTRYTVPLFQRPYVWNKEEQWQPLWDDVRALAERVLNPPAHKPVAGHFLGTVVLEQLKTAAIEMPQRQVIDGQQRLTTLQILLKATDHALSSVPSEDLSTEDATALQLAAGKVRQLSRNEYAQKPDEAFKVWPTNEDRAPFKGVMEADAATGIAIQQTRMADAYRFFRQVIGEWLDGSHVARRGQAMASALADHLRLIVLDLDETDEPQAIFETLNAHGTPLLPADLIKNWLLWQAGKQQLPADELYGSYWAQFDREHEYWRKKIGTGHAARPRVDLFLQSWLTAATKEAVPVKHLYDRFLAYASPRLSADDQAQAPVRGLMQEIKAASENYHLLDQPQGKGDLTAILKRLNRLDFIAFRPVLMAVISSVSNDEHEIQLAASALESFLVRRMVCDMQTRAYGTLAVDLIRSLPVEGSTSPLLSIIQGLEESLGGWPDDDAFRRNWTTRRFYGWFRRERVLVLLQAIEERLRDVASKSEPVLEFDFSKLTIEHIMPQSWAAHWPLPEGVSLEERETLIQNIGNLTLVSDKLNPHLSNSAWTIEGASVCKRSALDEHSDLKLNKRLLADHPDKWDEAGIRTRADALFEHARIIWPSASALKAIAAPAAGQLAAE